MCFFAVVSAEGLIVSGAALVAESTGDAAGASLLLLLQAMVATITDNKRINHFCINFLLYFISCDAGRFLFLAEEKPQRHSLKVKILSQLIFQVILIRLLDIIRIITEKSERRYMRR